MFGIVMGKRRGVFASAEKHLEAAEAHLQIAAKRCADAQRVADEEQADRHAAIDRHRSRIAQHRDRIDSLSSVKETAAARILAVSSVGAVALEKK